MLDYTTVGRIGPPTWPRQARVVEVQDENYRTRTLLLDVHMEAQPGQFVMAWLPGSEEKPFSLAGSAPVALTVVRVGASSAALYALRPGNRLVLRGPLGQGFAVRSSRALLVGGGYGVAPLGFLAERLLAAGAGVTVVIGARTAADLLLVERFRRLGIDPHLATEDGSAGTAGHVTAVINDLLRRDRLDDLYACGPEAMLDVLAGLTQAAGIPAHLSREALMRCGIGLCGSCERGGQLVCRDGPVFTLLPERAAPCGSSEVRSREESR